MTSGQQAGGDSGAADGAGAAGSESLSPEQIEERLRAQRVALAASARADHLREQAAAGAGRLREEARRLAEQAEQTWERAKQGDSEATSALTKAAAVAGGVVTTGIILARLARR